MRVVLVAAPILLHKVGFVEAIITESPKPSNARN